MAIANNSAKPRVSQRLTDLQRIVDRLQLTNDAIEVDRLLERLAHPSSPTVLSFLNAHAVNLAWKDPQFACDLLHANCLLRDGSGLKIGLTMLGRSPGLNLNGTDLIPRLLSKCRGRKAVLLGTCGDALQRAAEVIKTNYGVQVIDYLDGFQAPAAYLELVQARRPDVVLLAMGMPKQERVATMIRERTSHPALIINGGGVLDFISQRTSRAPVVVRKVGMEWAWRLLMEPKRLWKRYLIGNFAFMTRIAALEAWNLGLRWRTSRLERAK